MIWHDSVGETDLHETYFAADPERAGMGGERNRLVLAWEKLGRVKLMLLRMTMDEKKTTKALLIFLIRLDIDINIDKAWRS